jgi:23S rRNA pseudouridine1911/1915/1917 synthase
LCQMPSEKGVIKVIFEDEELLVLDKPTGWIVNSSGTTTTQPVIQNYLKTNYSYPLAQNDEFRSGVVHRLDKETSGVLLIAKTKEAFETLQVEFKNREVQKTYLALVHGVVKQSEGEIDAPVGRLPWRRDRFGVMPGGRSAYTAYKLKKVVKDQYSLLELFPKTGRTHQIRIHLKHIGHPVVADEFYAGRKTARNDRTWCPRLFLHAHKISFRHPQTHVEVSYTSDLPDDLKNAIV